MANNGRGIDTRTFRQITKNKCKSGGEGIKTVYTLSEASAGNFVLQTHETEGTIATFNILMSKQQAKVLQKSLPTAVEQ